VSPRRGCCASEAAPLSARGWAGFRFRAAVSLRRRLRRDMQQRRHLRADGRAAGGVGLQGRERHVLRLRPDRRRQDPHHDGAEQRAAWLPQPGAHHPRRQRHVRSSAQQPGRHAHVLVLRDLLGEALRSAQRPALAGGAVGPTAVAPPNLPARWLAPLGLAPPRKITGENAPLLAALLCAAAAERTASRTW
jgi:hypothetical protein